MNAVLAKMFPVDGKELHDSLERLKMIRDADVDLPLTPSHARVLCAVILRQEMRIRELEEIAATRGVSQ